MRYRSNLVWVTVQHSVRSSVHFAHSMILLGNGSSISSMPILFVQIPQDWPERFKDTLLIGDHVFVNREQFAPPTRWVGPVMPYRDIRRGDIVVFLSPEEQGLFVVKRIIGIPGDRIHLRDAVVYRDGQKLDEPYVRHKDESPNPYRDNFPAVSAGDQSNVIDEWKLTMPDHIDNGDIVVPPDSYFGMGDNRDVSLDSRYWGFIPRENVIGRPMFIYWSFDTPEDQYQQKGFGQRLAFLGHVIIHFFDGTRWKRTLKAVR